MIIPQLPKDLQSYVLYFNSFPDVHQSLEAALADLGQEAMIGTSSVVGELRKLEDTLKSLGSPDIRAWQSADSVSDLLLNPLMDPNNVGPLSQVEAVARCKALRGMSDALRKQWGDYYILQKVSDWKASYPMAFNRRQITHIWTRRLAYWLFCDFHRVLPWRLSSYGANTIETMFRFSPGRCNETFDPGNAGASWKAPHSCDLLTLGFYLIDKSFQHYLPFSTPEVFLGTTSLPANLNPISCTPSFSPDLAFVCDIVADVNPGEYFELVGNLVWRFPGACSSTPRAMISWLVDFLRIQGNFHELNFLHKNVNLAPYWNQKPFGYTTPQYVEALGNLHAGGLPPQFLSTQFNKANYNAWVNMLQSDLLAWKKAVSGGYASQFRHMWIAPANGCQNNGPQLKALLRAFGVCASTFCIAAPENKAGQPNQPDGYHVGILFQGQGLDCGLLHSDEQLAALDCGLSEFLPFLSHLSPEFTFWDRSTLALARDWTVPGPTEGQNVLAAQLESILVTPVGSAITLADKFKFSIQTTFAPGVSDLPPIWQMYFVRRRLRLLDWLSNGDSGIPYSVGATGSPKVFPKGVNSSLAKIAATAGSQESYPSMEKLIASVMDITAKQIQNPGSTLKSHLDKMVSIAWGANKLVFKGPIHTMLSGGAVEYLTGQVVTSSPKIESALELWKLSDDVNSLSLVTYAAALEILRYLMCLNLTFSDEKDINGFGAAAQLACLLNFNLVRGTGARSPVTIGPPCVQYIWDLPGFSKAKFVSSSSADYLLRDLDAGKAYGAGTWRNIPCQQGMEPCSMAQIALQVSQAAATLVSLDSGSHWPPPLTSIAAPTKIPFGSLVAIDVHKFPDLCVLGGFGEP